MILFVLLLVSSGLMYFYFQRCRSLERELTKWRSGVKVRETATTKPEAKSSITDIASIMREKIIGVPTTKTKKPAEPEKKAETASTDRKPRSEPRRIEEPTVEDEPIESTEEEPAAQPAKQAPRAAVAEVIEEPDAPESEVEQPRRTPAPERRPIKRAEAVPESADPHRRVIHSAYDAPQSFRGTTSQHSFSEEPAPSGRNTFRPSK